MAGAQTEEKTDGLDAVGSQNCERGENIIQNSQKAINEWDLLEETNKGEETKTK